MGFYLKIIRKKVTEVSNLENRQRSFEIGTFPNKIISWIHYNHYVIILFDNVFLSTFVKKKCHGEFLNR